MLLGSIPCYFSTFFVITRSWLHLHGNYIKIHAQNTYKTLHSFNLPVNNSLGLHFIAVFSPITLQMHISLFLFGAWNKMEFNMCNTYVQKVN